MRKIALYGKKGNGLFVLVDDEDYDYLNQYRWNLDINGYPRRSYRVGDRSANIVKCIQMHREVARQSDMLVEGLQIDHIDRNKMNCQRTNLRAVTQSENAFNRVTVIGISGLRGVRPVGNKWQAIVGGRNRIYLGKYDTPDEAAKVYADYVASQGLVVPYGKQ